jgi:formylglycine-generating enzyme required for sulfatase activity
MVAKFDANIGRLEAKVRERMTYRISSTSDQFKHDTTAKLVADLTVFVDPDRYKGLLADVRYRLAFAESVERETIVKHQDAWKGATEAIAASPKYHGLSIKPQLGLIPIGEDPRSHLWEFVHLQTVAPGTDPVPKRGQDGCLIVTEDMGVVFVLLPGGTFRMGAVKPDEDQAPTEPNVDPDAGRRENPVTSVTLQPFFMSKYEMTQGQWLRTVGRNPSRHLPDTNFGGKIIDLRHPVEWVTWDDCDQWLGRLGLVLPTEAQWEYGARGGTTSPQWTGLGTDGLSKAANIADQFFHRMGGPSHMTYEPWNDGYTAHAPVGSFDPNPFGLHDVLGNVFEWCRDALRDYDEDLRAGDGLRTSSVIQYRIARGGGFYSMASEARSAARASHVREFRTHALGVRPARPCRNP